MGRIHPSKGKSQFSRVEMMQSDGIRQSYPRGGWLLGTEVQQVQSRPTRQSGSSGSLHLAKLRPPHPTSCRWNSTIKVLRV